MFLMLVGLAACGPSQEEQMAAARAEATVQLEEAKEALYAKRQELAEARQALEAAIDEGAEDAADQIAEMEAKVSQLQGEVIGMSDEFSEAVVTFINEDPPTEGEPLTESQLVGIRMKSAEDLIVAQEHIDKGGDYRRALDIYNQALIVDPGNPDIEAAIARAEELRFMTQERLSQVKKGMSEREVRDLLGQPLLRNVREYPDRKVVAWFYPTTEEGDAAAVWFRANKAGDREVYQTKFEAIQKDSEESS
jgi:tetratricopeptide (TPR) repeat protein